MILKIQLYAPISLIKGQEFEILDHNIYNTMYIFHYNMYPLYVVEKTDAFTKS